MVWLFVLALAVWVFLQQQRLSELGERLARLAAAIEALGRAEPRAQALEPQAAPLSQAPPRPQTLSAAAERLAEPEAAPVPEAPAAAPPPAAMETATVQSEFPPPAPGPSISDWLSENGLAWIGGGALALGGLMLVAYAAERGFFTPAMRIGAAVILGLAAVGVGEALRRGVWAKTSPNRLVAALTTAAGAATLYAAIWAACLLYHFIPIGLAEALLAGVSLGLLALALLHGEPLGLLAILAAYAVPVVTGGDWNARTLDPFILLILATGMAVSGLRRWGAAALLGLAGAALWILARLASRDEAGGAAIIAAAPFLALGALAYDRWRPRAMVSPNALFEASPGVAAGGASFLAFLLWSFWSTGGIETVRYGALATAAIILAVAAGARFLRQPPGLLGAPAAVTVMAAVQLDLPPDAGVQRLWLAPLLVLLTLAGFDGARQVRGGRAAAVAGAAGTAIALTFAGGSLAFALGAPGWSVDALFAALLGVCAVLLVRRSQDARADLTPAVFIAAAAETTGLALHAALDGRAAPAGYAALALALAALGVRIRWRGFAESAAVAALASFAALLGPSVSVAALLGKMDWPSVTTAAGATAVIQLAAWRVLKPRSDVPGSIEAISTSALMSALLGAFLVVQIWGTARLGAPARLDPFTQASLRTLLLLAAGLMLSVRGAATPFGRARGPILLTLGAVHGLVLQGLVLHPWWSWSDGFGAAKPVLGPPLADTLLLGLLAPAALLLDAARRPGARASRLSGPAVGVALLFALLWLVSEIRRLFHGPLLGEGLFGYDETAAYAVALLALALVLDRTRARLGALAGSIGGAGGVIDASAWIAQGLALWLLAYVASPWWGPLEGDLKAPALLGALYVAGCALSARQAAAARGSARTALARAALIACGLEVFVLLTLAVRYGFHGAAMRAPLHEASIETWAFSAAWALYGLLLLAAGASRRDGALRGLGLAVLLGTTAKVFLFDLARLEGPIRAASFLALGVVLLLGALAARRFAGAGERASKTDGAK